MQNDLAWLRPKLAELCGLTLVDDYMYEDANHAVYLCYDPEQREDGEWFHPDEDVAQAIRCLESSKRPADIMFGGGNGELSWSCLLSNKRKPQYAATLAEAICLAIASALKWKRKNRD